MIFDFEISGVVLYSLAICEKCIGEIGMTYYADHV